MIFIIDKKIETPDEEAIAKGFESIDKSTSSNKGAISSVELSRSNGNSLAVSGHPVEGWLGLMLDIEGVTRAADISAPLTQEKIIRIFQSYARGNDLWEIEFQWDVIDRGKIPAKRVAILILIFLGILFIARSCAK